MGATTRVQRSLDKGHREHATSKMNAKAVEQRVVEISAGSQLSSDELHEEEIIGYVEPWIASPGQEVEVKVRLCANHWSTSC